MLNIGTTLYSKSLELSHVSQLKPYTLWLATPCFSLPPASGNQHSTLYLYELDYFKFFM